MNRFVLINVTLGEAVGCRGIGKIAHVHLKKPAVDLHGKGHNISLRESSQHDGRFALNMAHAFLQVTPLIYYLLLWKYNPPLRALRLPKACVRRLSLALWITMRSVDRRENQRSSLLCGPGD